MSDYDEIIESKSKPKENHFPKKDWKAEKISLFETANNAAVDTVYSGKNLRKYLETQSRFDKYSATNVLLIMSQKPEATQIKDYNSWQKAGVTVKKFEKSFSILEQGKEYKTESGEIRQNFNIKKMFNAIEQMVFIEQYLLQFKFRSLSLYCSIVLNTLKF